MRTDHGEEEGARLQLERRWFALDRAVSRLQQECELLEGLVQAMHADWRASRARLAELSAARDQLEESLSRLDQPPPAQAIPASRALSSAA